MSQKFGDALRTALGINFQEKTGANGSAIPTGIVPVQSVQADDSDDFAAQLAAVMQTLPQQAQASSEIVREVSYLLATRQTEQLSALQQRCWEVANVVNIDARQDNRVTVNHITNNIFIDSFNRECGNGRNRSDNNETEYEPNWGRGILFAVLAVWAFVLGGIVRDYYVQQGIYHQQRQGVPAYEVPPQSPQY